MSTDTSPKAAFNPEDMTGGRDSTIWQKFGSSNTLWVGVDPGRPAWSCSASCTRAAS